MIRLKDFVACTIFKNSKLNFYSKMTLQKIFVSETENSIEKATEILNMGQVIAVPTDTVYGLACNANDSVAIKKLYNIKGRDKLKPVAICVANLQNVKYYGKAEHLPENLLNELLPGPITIVLEKTKKLSSPFLNPGINKIGIRIPKLKFIQNLCSKLEFPIALTSANLSSEPSSLNIQEFASIWPSLGGIFDGGILSLDETSRSASTVIDLSVPDKYKIIRRGIMADEIVEILRKYGIKP
ncbi:threonylcarbamoyl-AMP synthase [Condylostylus longicornis]|uniref:threonylcarbamoyl-AMP synthase n=1 Tax=Condylostylus longicornis TaxID=2530218 RepID=UPI00244E2FF1|nr:threonylcarbamoyl-AMP synthase [Condylostylus longicornis]